MSPPTLDRRQLLIGTGAAVSAACFAAACGGPYVRRREVPARGRAVDEPPIVTALRYGITAPSPHNTQPWRFALLSDDHALLYTDPDRLLPHTDPIARQSHLSHGALVELAAIGASAIGASAEITLLPDGEVARGDFGRTPTASIRIAAGTGGAADPLVDAVELRRTSRLAHRGPAPTADEVAAVARAGSGAGVSSEILLDGLAPILELVQRAMAIEVSTPSLYDESLTWFRFSAREVAVRGDGLNLQTVDAYTIGARLFANAANFASASNRRGFLARFDRVVASTRSLLTMVTPANGMHDWLVCGRAYARAQLTAARLGLHMHPVSQALQELDEMATTRAALDRLIPVTPPGNLQMLVRLGRTAPPPVSPRRPLTAMMTS